jgi:hypothetical protein
VRLFPGLDLSGWSGVGERTFAIMATLRRWPSIAPVTHPASVESLWSRPFLIERILLRFPLRRSQRPARTTIVSLLETPLPLLLITRSFGVFESLAGVAMFAARPPSSISPGLRRGFGTTRAVILIRPRRLW